jgi:hypothetical protein
VPTVAQNLKKLGRKEATIPVSISYHIIDIFSQQLYASPNKALEELVANSYDAFATHVHVVVPESLTASDAVIWVVDDGTGMNAEGLVELWAIGASTKRANEDPKGRLPIGRFGIGKLSTYVLATQLTHVTKVKGTYRAVTMDFGDVEPKDGASKEKRLELPMRVLTESQAKEAVSPLLREMGAAGKVLKLFGPGSAKTWTVAAMAQLKPMALELSPGRLKWVLSTALPLAPDFALYFNGKRLASAKEAKAPLKVWTIGVDDDPAEELGHTSLGPEGGIEIAGIGRVTGDMALYEDLLTSGKAQDWGRSHGIFVMVRGRLINAGDALFGLPALSHGPFARWRLEIHADGLDEYLRASREAVLDTEPVRALRKYMAAKFNEARSYYLDRQREGEKTALLTNRVQGTPQSLSRRPLLNAIRAVFDGQVDRLAFTRVPADLDENGRRELLAGLEADLESEDGSNFIRDVRLEALGQEYGLAVFDVVDRVVLVNSLHPFYLNFAEHFNNPDPFKLIAVAEVLTEAYLFEQGIAADDVHMLMTRRDRFIRELVYSERLSAPLVAELLKDSRNSPDDLEKACTAALGTLGYEAVRISGSNEPDGIAYATLGVRNEATSARGDYSITYDAKSSGKDRVKAKDLNIAGVARHRTKYKSTFSLIVAPGFEGSKQENAAAVDHARTHRVTLMTIDDLIGLVLVAATHQVSLSQLRGFFDTCFTPDQVRAWIESLKETRPSDWPIVEILESIDGLQRDLDMRDRVKFAAVTHQLRMTNPKMKAIREADVRGWVATLERFAPNYVTVEGDVVTLETTPERIKREVLGAYKHLPTGYEPPRVVKTPTVLTARTKKLTPKARKKR